MNRQKAVLSAIATALAAIVYPSVSLARDQTPQDLTVEIVQADNECVGGLGLQESSTECVYKEVSALVNWLFGWVNEYQEFQLEVLKGKYPFYGVGISHNYVNTEENSDGGVLKATILEVWEGSPADKAGLKPNDVIVNVNGLAVSDITIRQDSATEALDVHNQEVVIRETIMNARDPFTIAVKQDGEVLTFALSKAVLGQEVADIIARNEDEIKKRRTAVKDMVGELVRQVEAHKDDKEMLLNFYDQFNDLDGYQDEPVIKILYVEAEKWGR